MMSIGDRGLQEPGPLRWPRRRDIVQREPASTSLYVFLLDADDDLAAEFDVRARIPARQLATARVLDAEAGDYDLAPWFDAVGDGPGLLVLNGLIAFETRICDRVATELLGAGDLIQPPSQRLDILVQSMGDWRALSATRLALLDADFAERVRPFPQIVQALLRRAERRSSEIDALRAITSQPRLEVRLVLVLWQLAARWGRVEPSGIRLRLPLTHRLLGQLVAAERPSVSHALKRLAHAGLVTGAACDLHLHGSIEEQLDSLIERPDGMAEPQHIGVGQPRPNGGSRRRVV
jgi:hypothetical protein